MCLLRCHCRANILPHTGQGNEGEVTLGPVDEPDSPLDRPQGSANIEKSNCARSSDEGLPWLLLRDSNAETESSLSS